MNKEGALYPIKTYCIRYVCWVRGQMSNSYMGTLTDEHSLGKAKGGRRLAIPSIFMNTL